jgi:Trypsin
MLRRILLSLSIVVVTNFLAYDAFSIVIRHDRDDEKYLALGAKYPVVGFFQENVGCTLIAPRWAITAAHVVESNPAFIDYYVMFGGTRYEIEKIIIHPKRVRDTVDSSADIALLKLKEPVTGITPALLYDRMDEGGKQVVLAGYGRTGNGLTGITGDRGKLRGATNEIEGALENSLLLVFDAPPLGTELEGINGPGDSGSPALYEENGKLYIMGVSSFNSGSVEKGTASKYWTFEGYARISTRRQWILDVIKADPPSAFWGDLKKIENSIFPANVFGRRAAAFFKAFNSGKESEIANFYAAHRPPNPEGKTPQERAKGWQELMGQYGKYEVYGYSQAAHRYSFLVYAEGEKIWRGVLLEFEEKPPYKVKSMRMWDAKPPKDVAKR